MNVRDLFENAAGRQVRRAAAYLLAGALAISPCAAVRADDAAPHPDAARDGSSTLSIAMTDRATGKAVPGGQLRLYQIAEIMEDGDWEFALTDSFAGCPGISVKGDNIELADPYLSEYAAALKEQEPESVSEEAEEPESISEEVEEPESVPEEPEDAEEGPEAMTAADIRLVTAKYLNQYIRDNGVSGKDPTVAELGEVSWSKLALGIYLICEIEPIDGYADVNPFFMVIPEAEYDENGEFTGYEYDVDAVPKMDKIHTPVIY